MVLSGIKKCKIWGSVFYNREGMGSVGVRLILFWILVLIFVSCVIFDKDLFFLL